MWNSVQHKEVELPMRIEHQEINNLKAYLMPFQFQKEREKSITKAEKNEEEKYRNLVKNWLEDYKKKVEGITGEEEEEKEEEANESDIGDVAGDNDQIGDESDDEYKQDSEAIDPEEIIVREANLDQYLKGDRIDIVGQKLQLGEDTLNELANRAHIDSEPDIGDDEDAIIAAGGENTNNFFAQQRAARIKAMKSREDKHLLPKKIKNERVAPEMEYGEIDLIFNHKNVWANLQHADPTKILYHIHDDTMWLPFVRDDIYPHQWDDEDAAGVEKFKKWQKFVDGQTNLEINKSDPEWKKMNLKTVDYLIKGEYLQPFQPFYGPKERLPPLSRTEVLAKEQLLEEKIKGAVEQIRSIAQINQTQWNPTLKMRRYIDDYINYMEDYLAGRFSKE